MADESEEKVCCRCSLEYASTACSRTPFSLDWGRNGQVVYGGCNCVVLYRPEDENSASRVQDVLSGHKDRINCVRWIKNELEPEKEIVSGSTDKTVIVWSQKKDKWCPLTVLQGHTNTVNSVAAITVRNGDQHRTIISSSSADSTVRIWERTEIYGDFQCTQTLSFGYGFAVTTDLTVCPGTKVPILACGNEDSKIHIFVEKESQFIKIQSLVGHEDWIRGVEFTLDDSGDLLLASCSKDCFIRIWRISSTNKNQKHVNDDVKSPMTAGELLEDLGELKLTSNLFTVNHKDKESEFSVVLESVLSGHEDIVYSVHWQPAIKKDDGSSTQPLSLLSASFDKTLIIWKPDEETGVWLEMVRVGGVGGTTLGFFGGVLSPDGLTILGHSYQGAFHIWRNVAANQGEAAKWIPGVTISGHFGSVQDICWDPEEGQFLMSVSTDQTTRLHAPWHRHGKQTTWHEIARPQVHGYDMQCFTLVDRYTLASGADEKVVRIFKAPRQFLESLQSLSNIKESSKLPQDLPLGASVPALGLSNKAVFEGDLNSLKRDTEDPGRPLRASAFASEEPLPFSPVVSKAPPTEDHLLQNTLWPESQKLYGHGFEIFCVASNPEGTLLATSCKASKAEHASIILWDTTTWRQVASLSGHTLTVTQMAFSHSGQHLLTVSRDRSWAVFKRLNESGLSFSLVSHSTSLKKNQQHSRIIWACSWSHDDQYFATASRDKKVILWGCNVEPHTDREDWTPVSSPLDVGEPATAVDMAPTLMKDSSYLVAIGTESGHISLYSWSPGVQWKIINQLDQSLCPVLSVKRLKWRPTKRAKEDGLLHLACCSADHSVRVTQVSGLV